METRQFGSSDCAHVEAARCKFIEQHGGALAGDGGSALPNHPHTPDPAAAQALHDRRGNGPCAQVCAQQAIALHDLAAQRLAETERRLADLLEEEVRIRASVNVARGHLGGGNL